MSETTKLTELFTFLQQTQSNLDSLKGQSNLLENQINELSSKIKISEQDILNFKKAIELLMFLDEENKQYIKQCFEEIVTYALQYIFNNKEYKCEIMFGRRGNSQEIDFVIKTPDSIDFHDPMTSNGGGVLDVLSLALRISLMEITRPKIEGFIALDEPFKHLSANYMESARDFLKVINQKIKRQLIIVTHEEELINFVDNKIKIGGIKNVD